VAYVKTSTRWQTKHSGSKGLLLIGAYKLLEGLLLAAVAVGLLKLLHRDVAALVIHWVHVLRVDPDNRYIHRLLARIFAVSPKQLRELSAGTFFYAVVRLTEGTGLLLRKRWAEYLTVVMTGVFIPLEVYELVRHYTTLKLAVFVVNAAIVWYLISGLREKGAAPRR
jgi:uncharacterized membrane protein (DUF2068 family)